LGSPFSVRHLIFSQSGAGLASSISSDSISVTITMWSEPVLCIKSLYLDTLVDMGAFTRV